MLTRREFLKIAALSVALSDFPAIASQNNHNGRIKITVVGDVTLGFNFPPPQMKDLDYPFERVREIFHAADLSFANLEGALTTRGVRLPKRFNFRGDSKYAACLRISGMDVVSLANNHTMDFGYVGLQDTIDALKSQGISYTGAGRNEQEARKPAIIVNDRKIGFLAYSEIGPYSVFAAPNKPGAARIDLRHVAEDVEKLKEQADFVLVSYHWGIEGKNYPTERQKTIGRETINAGADVVLGHHPHVLQGIEEYKSGLIAYSLGNFCFGGNSNPSDKDSIILRIYLNGRSVQDYDAVPVKITSREAPFQPRPLEGREAKRVLERLQRYSKGI